MTARGAIAVVLALLAAAGCEQSRAASRPAGRPAVPVAVARAGVRDVPERVEAVGTVEAYQTVAVRSQVAGQVTAVAFREGQDVKKGDLLFRIDARPFQAVLAQAEANHSRGEAQARSAAADAQRAEALFKEGILSREQHEQAAAQARSQAAAATADAAVMEGARLNVANSAIRAPMSGRTGSVLIHVGNVVKADDSPLVVINRVRPIYVSFAIPEQKLAAVRASEAAHRLAAEAVVAGDTAGPVRGRLSFVDNEVDRQTGTIRLKAEFANAEGRLWPGQFATVRLTLGVRAGAVVVPAEAVQAGQKGSYVFVVKPDKTVEQRTVTTGPAWEDQTVVESGVRAGETVVVDGQMGLVPGSAVSIKAGVGGS